MASPNAAKAFRAILILAADPNEAIPMLRDRLRPPPAPADNGPRQVRAVKVLERTATPAAVQLVLV